MYAPVYRPDIGKGPNMLCHIVIVVRRKDFKGELIKAHDKTGSQLNQLIKNGESVVNVFK